MINICFPILNC